LWQREEQSAERLDCQSLVRIENDPAAAPDQGEREWARKRN